MNSTQKTNPPAPSSLEKCLRPLLEWLKWSGSDRELAESMPFSRTLKSVDDFRFVMGNLGYESDIVRVKLRRLDMRLLPCLFIPKDRTAPLVLEEKVGDRLSYFDGQTGQVELKTPTNQSGYVVIFRKKTEKLPGENVVSWFKLALAPHKKLLRYILFLTMLQSFLLLASPIFTMSIYDKIIATQSFVMLSTFSFGVLLSLIMLAVITMVRYRVLAHLGVYIQQSVGNTIFRQLLKLPPVYTESAPVGSQMARLNDFNSVRDFFGSPLFGTLIEVPFIVIYLVAVWVVGGIWLLLIPVVFSIFSIIVAMISWRLSKERISNSARVHLRQQNFLVETLWGMRSVQYAGLQERWKDRFRNMSSEASLSSQRLQLISTSNDVLFDFIMTLAGLSVIVVGAILVMDNIIQIGALIGVMFIVWRVLTPIKTISTMLPRLIQLKRSIVQVDELMRLQPESDSADQKRNTPTQLSGAISFSQVSFRYPGADMPALAGINFTIQPKQMFSIIGPSASGKSTIVNLILAMYLPQAGRVYIDGCNIQQFNVNMLRTHIAYVAQKAELFYGTIAQNLRLSDPTATDDQLIQVAKASNLLKDVEALPEGFQTLIGNYGDKKFGASFCQKLNLARAYLRDAPIMVMDEPSTALDAKSIECLLNYLTEMKGKKTIVIISHQRALIELSDVLIVLSDGKQVMLGAPAEVLDKMPKGLI